MVGDFKDEPILLHKQLILWFMALGAQLESRATRLRPMSASFWMVTWKLRYMEYVDIHYSYRRVLMLILNW